MTPLEEKIVQKIDELRSEYEFQKASVGSVVPLSVALVLAFQSIATQAVEEYKKELLENSPKRIENGNSPPSSNPIDEYIWHEQNGKNSMLSQFKSLINKSN